MKKALFALLALTVSASFALAEQTLFRYSGSLDYGDAVAEGGAYLDQFAISADRGERVGVVLVSVDFSPRLSIASSDTVHRPASEGVGAVYAELTVDDDEVLVLTVSGARFARGAYSVRVFELPPVVADVVR